MAKFTVTQVFDAEELRKIQAALGTHIRVLEKRLKLADLYDKAVLETDRIMLEWRQLKATIEIGLARVEDAESSTT